MSKDEQKQAIRDDPAVASWWNVRRAALYLGMSESFVRKSVRLHRIPFIRIGEKAIRFQKVDLDEWLVKQ